LVRSARFSLPGKRRLLDPETDWEVVVLDASEIKSEIEVGRPQKTARLVQRQEEATHSESSSHD